MSDLPIYRETEEEQTRVTEDGATRILEDGEPAPLPVPDWNPNPPYLPWGPNVVFAQMAGSRTFVRPTARQRFAATSGHRSFPIAEPG